jgi:hypothetical protein
MIKFRNFEQYYVFHPFLNDNLVFFGELLFDPIRVRMKQRLERYLLQFCAVSKGGFLGSGCICDYPLMRLP